MSVFFCHSHDIYFSFILVHSQSSFLYITNPAVSYCVRAIFFYCNFFMDYCFHLNVLLCSTHKVCRYREEKKKTYTHTHILRIVFLLFFSLFLSIFIWIGFCFHYCVQYNLFHTVYIYTCSIRYYRQLPWAENHIVAYFYAGVNDFIVLFDLIINFIQLNLFSGPSFCDFV